MKPRRHDAWYKSLTGKTVGDFTLLEYLGSGKIGYVYRAQSHKLPDCERALKLIFNHLNDGWDTELKKVVRLAQVLGVVQFHDLGTAQITCEGKTHLCQYTVWDYIAPGENLKQYLERVEQIHTSFLVAVVERILHVLHACQVKGVGRHGDLHSGNILVGEASDATVDDSLHPRAPIFVSDFGYGATGAARMPKNDYDGLAAIFNEIASRVDRGKSTATDKQILEEMRSTLGKLLREPVGPERRKPLELLQVLYDIKRRAQSADQTHTAKTPAQETGATEPDAQEPHSVGTFQVTEMIGDRWH